MAGEARTRHAACVEEHRTDLLRTTSPWRLAALRALVCLGGALLLASPILLLGDAAARVAVVVLAAHAALSVAAVSWAELRAVRSGRLVRGAIVGALVADVCVAAGVGQAWFAWVAWSRGHDVAYAALEGALSTLAAHPGVALGVAAGVLLVTTALWAVPLGLLTYERLHGRSPDSLPLWLGVAMGWVPGTVVLVALAFCYALAADWDERLGGVAEPARSDGSGTIGRRLRHPSVPGLKST